MEHIFWKDGDFEGRGGIFIRNNLKEFFKKLQENGLNPIGLKIDIESFNLEVIVEYNECYRILYESDTQHIDNE